MVKKEIRMLETVRYEHIIEVTAEDEWVLDEVKGILELGPIFFCLDEVASEINAIEGVAKVRTYEIYDAPKAASTTLQEWESTAVEYLEDEQSQEEE